jgi:hypothetical protein
MSQSESKQFRRNYKYNHLDADELRKRREDNTIMLRKQKRDEQVCFIFLAMFLKFILILIIKMFSY